MRGWVGVFCDCSAGERTKLHYLLAEKRSWLYSHLIYPSNYYERTHLTCLYAIPFQTMGNPSVANKRLEAIRASFTSSFNRAKVKPTF